MGSVCFIVDAMVTGEMLPRHLQSIRESGVADRLLPILVTATQAQERLSTIEQRYHAHSLITPAQPLGARLNRAAFVSQAEWLIIALQKKPLSADLWGSFYPQLDTYNLDALIIGLIQPKRPERILRRLLASALILPPYIAVRRVWLERLGGFDPELDENSAIDDFLRRLHDCPTRLKTYSGLFLSQKDVPDEPILPNPETAVTPRP